MKQIPILMSTPMVLATDDDLKTMTRRMNGLAKVNEAPDAWTHGNAHGGAAPYNQYIDAGHLWVVFWKDGSAVYIKSPYGKPGDVLWVREMLEQHGELGLSYVAGNEWMDEDIIPADYGPYGGEYSFRKIPSIHMPKWAARYWLEVVSVRVERLKDISPDDAAAEGVIRWNEDYTSEPGAVQADYENYMWRDDPAYEDFNFPCYANPCLSFFSLWEYINGGESLGANPWVWVVEFKVLSKTGKPEHL